jgi:hypothetical protein
MSEWGATMSLDLRDSPPGGVL